MGVRYESPSYITCQEGLMVKKISLILILLLIAFPAAFAAVDVDLVGASMFRRKRMFSLMLIMDYMPA